MKKIIAAIVILLTLTSCVSTTDDISKYAFDVEKYEAGSFMPDLKDIGNYEEVKYFARKDESIFFDYSMRLVAKYDEQTFLKEKERLESAYNYLNKPQKAEFDDAYYTIPVTEFFVSGFDFRVVRLKDPEYPKYFGMVGVSEDTYEIAYLWMYSPDLDYICKQNEDTNGKMVEFVKHYFSL